MFLGCGEGSLRGGVLFLESIIEAMTASMILSSPASNNITAVLSAWKYLLSQYNCVNKLIYQKHTRVRNSHTPLDLPLYQIGSETENIYPWRQTALPYILKQSLVQKI